MTYFSKVNPTQSIKKILKTKSTAPLEEGVNNKKPSLQPYKETLECPEAQLGIASKLFILQVRTVRFDNVIACQRSLSLQGQAA